MNVGGEIDDTLDLCLKKSRSSEWLCGPRSLVQELGYDVKGRRGNWSMYEVWNLGVIVKWNDGLLAWKTAFLEGLVV